MILQNQFLKYQIDAKNENQSHTHLIGEIKTKLIEI